MMGHGKPNLVQKKVITRVDDRKLYVQHDAAAQDLINDATAIGQDAIHCSTQAKRLQAIIFK